MKNSRHSYAKRAAKPDRTGPDGFVYDSKTEMLRGLDLILLERAGEISDLQRQVKFPLECQSGIYEDEPLKIMVGPKRDKVAVYTPDFVYMEKGVRVVEDVKGYPDEASKFRIRVFEALYSQKVTIVKKIRGVGWVIE